MFFLQWHLTIKPESCTVWRIWYCFSKRIHSKTSWNNHETNFHNIREIYELEGECTIIFLKIQKIWTPENIAVIILKFEQCGSIHRVMSPKDVDGMANSVDPDQISPVGPVWSGSALFAKTCLSKNLGSLQHFHFFVNYTHSLIIWDFRFWWLALTY